MNDLDICRKVLEKFNIEANISLDDLLNLKEFKSQIYACGPIYAFDFKNSHYYAVDDYSLDENPDLVKNILLEINHQLKGEIVKNPENNSEFPYSIDLDKHTYYLWKTDKN